MIRGSRSAIRSRSMDPLSVCENFDPCAPKKRMASVTRLRRRIEFEPAGYFGALVTEGIGIHSRFFSNCMLSASPRISLVSTSKLAGVPASSVFSPFTIDS